jgi:hypothetical protein
MTDEDKSHYALAKIESCPPIYTGEVYSTISLAEKERVPSLPANEIFTCQDNTL